MNHQRLIRAIPQVFLLRIIDWKIGAYSSVRLRFGQPLDVRNGRGGPLGAPPDQTETHLRVIEPSPSGVLPGDAVNDSAMLDRARNHTVAPALPRPA
jgi:hypothetical protein